MSEARKYSFKFSEENEKDVFATRQTSVSVFRSLGASSREDIKILLSWAKSLHRLFSQPIDPPGYGHSGIATAHNETWLERCDRCTYTRCTSMHMNFKMKAKQIYEAKGSPWGLAPDAPATIYCAHFDANSYFVARTGWNVLRNLWRVIGQ